MKLRGTYFCGNKISEYGIANKRLDYSTLSKAFDAVLVNDITKLFYSSVNGEYIEPEQVNGFIDNSEEIEEIQERIEALNDTITETTTPEYDAEIYAQMDALEEEIIELEREQDETPEIYQYYIVSDTGADIIKRYTNDPLFYIDFLGVYVWGVTHYGTAWSYVLTGIEIEEDAKQ